MIHWIFAGLVGAIVVLILLEVYLNYRVRDEKRAYRIEWPSGVAAILLFPTAVVGLLWALLGLMSAECRRIELQAGQETEYFFPGGCFIQLDDGRSVPVDSDSIGLILSELSDDG